MKTAYDIVIKPIITEQSMEDTEMHKYVFQVAPDANKVEIAKAIEEIFGVKVEQVNILNCKPKTKRMGKYVGKTSAVRKAVVKLPEGQDINLFSE